jgi:hypothetical protein
MTNCVFRIWPVRISRCGGSFEKMKPMRVLSVLAVPFAV